MGYRARGATRDRGRINSCSAHEARRVRDACGLGRFHRTCDPRCLRRSAAAAGIRRCPRGTSPGPRRGERQRDGSAARHAGNRVGRPGRRPGERAAGGITWRGVVPREAGERCNRRSVAARLLDPNAAARGAQTVAVRIRWRARLDCGDQYAKHPGVGDATAGDVLREGQCCVPRQYSLAERRIRRGPRPDAARQRRQRAGCAGGRVRRHPDTTADDIVRTIGGSAVCVRCRVLCDLVRPRATVDPPAFYHQRYVLPALLPIVAALPLLAHEMLAWRMSAPVWLSASL